MLSTHVLLNWSQYIVIYLSALSLPKNVTSLKTSVLCQVTSVVSDSLWPLVCSLCPWDWLSRQEYWSGLPFHLPGDLPSPGIQSHLFTSTAFAGGFFTTSATKTRAIYYHHIGIRYSVSEMDCLDENPSTSFCKLVTWGKFLTSLCLNFLIYKMWIIKEPTSQDVVKWQRCIKHVLSSWGLICFVLWILTRLCLQRKGIVTCVLRFMVGLALC